MDKNNVPQDQNKNLRGLRKAMYAVDDDGNYVVVPSDGWVAEELVLNQAIEEFERHTIDALARCHSGESSPLDYHMSNNRMDLVVLAQSTGFFKWQVKRHLLPRYFEKISDKQLGRYADALGISIETLQSVPEKGKTYPA